MASDDANQQEIDVANFHIDCTCFWNARSWCKSSNFCKNNSPRLGLT